MASGSEPEKKKRPAKRTARSSRKSASEQSGRKSGRKRDSGGDSARPRKIPSTPLLVAWALALVVLAGLIYAGTSGRRLELPKQAAVSKQSTPTSSSSPVRESKPVGPPSGESAKSTHVPRPAHPNASSAPTSEPAHPKLPDGPILPPKPHFSSKDIPSYAHDRESLSLALNKPAEPPAPKVPPAPAKPASARAAIIIDDFGQDLESAKKFLGLPFQVTFSVLPFLHHSREICELVHAQGREVILHCPMEPLGYPKVDPGRGALLLSMSADALRRNLRSALDTSPYFSGVNNHMGSRITENSDSMKTVLEEIHRHGLYFVDSCTSPRSVGWSVARQLKMPSGKRSVFLDHNASPASIRSQIARLIRVARVEGAAIGIGHPHESTLKALREAASLFQQEGVQIVPAREIVGGK